MLAARQQIYDQDARTVFLNANPGQQKLGQVAETPDGRAYQYGLAGATNLVAGSVTSPVAKSTNSVAQTGTANAIGTTAITYTVGATAITADQFKGGYFCVTTGPGQNVYLIVGNTAVASAGGSITVTIADGGLTVATTTSSLFTLLQHPQANVVIQPEASAPNTIAVGVPNVAVTGTYYFWNQVGGYCSVLADGVTAKGAYGIASTNTNGAVITAGTSTITQFIGYAPEASVTAIFWPFVLTLPLQ